MTATRRGLATLRLKAFAILYRQPQLFVCLATSAGDAEHSGFHLFLFQPRVSPLRGLDALA